MHANVNELEVKEKKWKERGSEGTTNITFDYKILLIFTSLHIAYNTLT